MLGMHNLLSHVKKPGAHVFDSCGHVLLFCGSNEPGQRHSPTGDIVMPSGQRHEYCLFGAPTQIYEHLFDFSHAFVPV